MHITIREGRSLPDLQRCTTCCKDIHCPLCASNVFHPAKLNKVQAHLESHFNRAVLHEDNSTLMRKADFIKHLALCKAKHTAITPFIYPYLSYTLSIVTSAGFEFQEMDMPLILKWWCFLLMERFQIQGHGQRFAFWTLEARSLLEGTLQPVFRVPRQSARMDISQEKLPEGIIRRILGFVVLEDGNPAICTLALTCKNLNYIVSQWSFQKETHFNWLGSVVNWNLLTEGHKREFRKAYHISSYNE
ncbi:hypothetical protein JOQ06_028727 [Pogonophryne albipinna]|uniref:F-box domain-containing protein n=1 Tax=Pogonophryne albipinna TaxID=1090488 RepID=A0AAD6FLZ1_9TELE|nr:hypothetical protein JOQ06_028727 [Pogonophryne albipinna]